MPERKAMPKSQTTPNRTPAAPPDALAAFHARLESGRFNVVLGSALRRTIRDAAVDTGLDAEVGALRLALARLLTEERDPSRLAAGVSRLTGVAVQAARLRQVDSGAEFAAIRDTVLRELDAMEAELAAEQAASFPSIPAGDWYDPAFSFGPESPDAESPSPRARGEGLG